MYLPGSGGRQLAEMKQQIFIECRCRSLLTIQRSARRVVQRPMTGPSSRLAGFIVHTSHHIRLSAFLSAFSTMPSNSFQGKCKPGHSPQRRWAGTGSLGIKTRRKLWSAKVSVFASAQCLSSRELNQRGSQRGRERGGCSGTT